MEILGGNLKKFFDAVSSPTRAAQTALCNYIEQRNKQKIFQTGL